MKRAPDLTVSIEEEWLFGVLASFPQWEPTQKCCVKILILPESGRVLFPPNGLLV